MRYWLTYFWTLCFVPSPHNLSFLQLPSFLPTKFARSFLFSLFFFLFYFSLSAHRFSESRGQVRGHLAQPRCRAWATWQQRPPLLEICRSVANFHLHPLPSSLSVKKTPAGMLQWGAASTRVSVAVKFGCCHEKSHTGNSSARKRWDIKEVMNLCFGSRTKTLRDDAATFMVTTSCHCIIGWWAASFGCQDLFSKCV